MNRVLSQNKSRKICKTQAFAPQKSKQYVWQAELAYSRPSVMTWKAWQRRRHEHEVLQPPPGPSGEQMPIHCLLSLTCTPPSPDTPLPESHASVCGRCMHAALADIPASP